MASTEPMAVHTQGSKVWVKDPVEVWIKGEVIKVDGQSLVVKTEGGQEVRVAAEDAPIQNPDVRGGVEDMTRLPYLHEPGVLGNLRDRYMFDDIYTYTGSILIAVNPFANLAHLYGSHMMDQYRVADFGELSPHVYAIADSAYQAMRKENKGQSILVSGESGAGKTETSKLIMKYLAYMGGFDSKGSKAAGDTGQRSVEEQILESNPLLEAFGNAKTVRNYNSSRFGKYIEINFNSRGCISGAAIRTYLLEKSRVVAVNDPERNYHIFYQLCDGATEEEKARWRLRPAQHYLYLNQSTCYTLPRVDNAKEFRDTVHAMTKVGMTPEDQEYVFRVVSAILSIGNITFTPDDNDGCTVDSTKGEEALSAAAALLEVDKEGLRKSMTTRTRHTPDGAIVSPLNVAAAVSNRDSLAKILYSKLFDLLVARINGAIGEDTKAAASIGVLDIYGFESFKINDFEQLCINLANEKLQQHFNHHVFKGEQAEYEKEKIDWSYIQFVDNQDVLDLLEGKFGVLDLLDEQCRFPTATAKDLANKFYTSDLCKNSNRFSKPKTSQTSFTINHYAGEVTYDGANFLEKNKDFVVAEHQQLLSASTCPLVAELFFDPEAANADPKKQGFKFNSVGSQFKKQLGELMTQLNLMEPHYVRCIKPNGQNKPAVFENANSLHQLRCGGVLEAVRISCAGFPSRRPYADFVDHFWLLEPSLHKSGIDDREITKRILLKSGIEGYQMGLTKVFLRAGHMAMLDKVRTDHMNKAATTIQKLVKGRQARQHYAEAKKAIVTLQSAVRAQQARKAFWKDRKEHAATLIQTLWRGHRDRRRYLIVRKLVMRLQARWRGTAARNNFDRLKRFHAAVVIQKHYRIWREFNWVRQSRQAAVVMQSMFRAVLARRQLRALRAEYGSGAKIIKLEERIKEVEGSLEVVVGQRNELRQQLKDEMGLRLKQAEDSYAKIKVLEGLLAAAATKVALEEFQAVQAANATLEATVAGLQEQLQASKAASAAAATAAAAELAAVTASLAVMQSKHAEAEKSIAESRAETERAQSKVLEGQTQRDLLAEKVLSQEAEIERMRELLTVRERQLQVANDTIARAAMMPAIQEELAGLDRAPAKQRAGGVFRATSDRFSIQSAPVAAAPITFGRSKNLGAITEDGDESMDALPTVDERESRLLAAIAKPMGFYNNKPLAAIITFRCLAKWGTFQEERTQMFDDIIHVFSHAVEEAKDDMDALAYWLVNSVNLLHLLQKYVKPAVSGQTLNKRAAALGTNFTRSSTLEASQSTAFKPIEAMYPALLFKQQLDAMVQKIFPMIRNMVKRDITPMLANCIHVPKSALRSRTLAAAPNGAQLAVHKAWSDILFVFDKFFGTLTKVFMPDSFIAAFYVQLFEYMNSNLFNQLLLRRECCSFSNGEHVKAGLAQVEAWINQQDASCVGVSWQELLLIRQATQFLVAHNKNKMTKADLESLCSALSIAQIYRLCTMYWDDKYNTETFSAEVLNEVKTQALESESPNFLLEDQSDVPFSAADVLLHVKEKGWDGALPVPEELDTGDFSHLSKPVKSLI